MVNDRRQLPPVSHEENLSGVIEAIEDCALTAGADTPPARTPNIHGVLEALEDLRSSIANGGGGGGGGGGLNYRGMADFTAAAPDAPENGDLYINTTDGAAAASWNGIAGEEVTAGAIAIFGPTAWALAGNCDGTDVVEKIVAAAPITVDSANPKRPVVGAALATTSSAGVVSLASQDDAKGNSDTKALTPGAAGAAFARLPLPGASTSQAGIVQLTGDLSSISVSHAPTADALRQVNQLASSANSAAQNALPITGGTLMGDLTLTPLEGQSDGVLYANADGRLIRGKLPAATSETAGLTRYSTAQEVSDGTNTSSAVTPKALKPALDSKATSAAVTAAQNAAAAAQSTANAANTAAAQAEKDAKAAQSAASGAAQSASDAKDAAAAAQSSADAAEQTAAGAKTTADLAASAASAASTQAQNALDAAQQPATYTQAGRLMIATTQDAKDGTKNSIALTPAAAKGAFATNAEATTSSAGLVQLATPQQIDDGAIGAFAVSAHDANATFARKPLPLASESAPGLAQIATQAQVNAGDDETTYITPWTLAGYMNSENNRALVYKGTIVVSDPAPSAPKVGDLYINETFAYADSSWAGISGDPIAKGEMVLWDGAKWDPVGKTTDTGAVTEVQGTAPILVSQADKNKPVVSIKEGDQFTSGAVRFATQQETNDGTIQTAAVTPKGMHGVTDQIDGVARNAQATANAALPKSGGSMGGTITFAAGQQYPGVLSQLPDGDQTTWGLMRLATETEADAGATNVAITPGQVSSTYVKGPIPSASQTTKGLTRLATLGGLQVTDNSVALTAKAAAELFYGQGNIPAATIFNAGIVQLATKQIAEEGTNDVMALTPSAAAQLYQKKAPLPVATTTTAGITRLATLSEAEAGTAANIAVTPSGLQSQIGKVKPKCSYNRIINGDFQIWQRGESQNLQGFLADRWFVRGSSLRQRRAAITFGKHPNAIEIENLKTVDNDVALETYIELPGAGISGEYQENSEWALSFWFSNTPPDAVTLAWSNGPGDTNPVVMEPTGFSQLEDAGSYFQFVYKFKMSKNASKRALAVRINRTLSGNGFANYFGVQLEPGVFFTAYAFEDPGQALARCQRYFQAFSTLQPGVTSSSGSSWTFSAPRPVEMYAATRAPVEKISNSGDFNGFQAAGTGSSINVTALTSNFPEPAPIFKDYTADAEFTGG